MKTTLQKLAVAMAAALFLVGTPAAVRAFHHQHSPEMVEVHQARVEQLVQALNLSSEQVAQLTPILASAADLREERHETRRKGKEARQMTKGRWQELDKAEREDLKAFGKGLRADVEEQHDEHMNLVRQVKGILSPEQLATVEKLGTQWKEEVLTREKAGDLPQRGPRPAERALHLARVAPEKRFEKGKDLMLERFAENNELDEASSTQAKTAIEKILDQARSMSAEEYEKARPQLLNDLRGIWGTYANETNHVIGRMLLSPHTIEALKP